MSSEVAAQQPIESDRDDGDGPDREPATIARSPDGDVRGVAIVLGADDLRKLGISLAEVDAVVPRVYNGALILDPVS